MKCRTACGVEILFDFYEDGKRHLAFLQHDPARAREVQNRPRYQLSFSLDASARNVFEEVKYILSRPQILTEDFPTSQAMR